MNESIKFSGVVSAYDATTGRTLFSGLHNVVTVREKILALAKLTGMTAANIEDNAYIPDDMTYSVTDLKNQYANNSISHFRVGCMDGSTFPVEYTDRLNDFEPTASFLKEISHFDGTENYRVSDLDPNEIPNIDKKWLIYTKEGGAFARFKLIVNGSDFNLGSDQTKEINLLGLCDNSGNILTQFKFPSIMFYSNTQVDFEYRLYL